jgi:hypothetical protein
VVTSVDRMANDDSAMHLSAVRSSIIQIIMFVVTFNGSDVSPHRVSVRLPCLTNFDVGSSQNRKYTGHFIAFVAKVIAALIADDVE